MRSSLVDDDQVIDLKEIFLYVCRKWRVLIILGLIGIVVGIVVGIGVGSLQSQPNAKKFELEELHLKEIEQYARYQQLYEEQADWEKESVLLNMDPYATYTGEIRYYLQLKETDNAVVFQLYSTILSVNEIYENLIAASGIDCTLRAMQQLVSLEYSVLNQQERLGLFGNRVLTVQVRISAIAPSLAAIQAMLDLIDAQVQETNRYVETGYGAILRERLATPCQKDSYNWRIANERKNSTDKLSEYGTKISTIGKELTENDKNYYGYVYDTEKEKTESLTWVKWALIVGVVFGMLGAGWYAVIYLLDGHVKNEDELLAYGLHPFAVVKGSEERKKPNALDRLLMPKYRYQSDDYLAEALDVLDAESIVICGDLGDADIANHAQSVAEASQKLHVAPQMVESAKTQAKAKQADGVVLFVHLWKTKRADLEQEIRICQKIGARVLGVAIIG